MEEAALVEALIGNYLTRGDSVFVSPQFNVAWDDTAREGGTCPDFVALDYSKSRKQVVIVEVTSASSLDSLFSKIDQRERGRYQPIVRHLTAIGAINIEWEPPRLLGFVRESNFAQARDRYAGEPDVGFHPMERALLEYAYFVERQKGLPCLTKQETEGL
jgi:hypothetical protein